MGKYGKITERLAASNRRMEALEAKMAEARAKYEEALTQQAEQEEAADAMRRELLGRYTWRYCRAGQLIPQLDKLVRSGDADIDEQRALFGLAPLTEKEKSEAAKEEAALEAVLVPAVDPHPAVEVRKRSSRSRKAKESDPSPIESAPTAPDTVPTPDAEPSTPIVSVPPAPNGEARTSECEAPAELTEGPEEGGRFGVFDGAEVGASLDDAPTPELLTGFDEPPAETADSDELPIMDPDAAPDFLSSPSSPATDDPLLF